MKCDARTILGVGLYTPAETAHLLGVPYSTVRRWVDGYTFASREASRRSPAVVHRELDETNVERLLTFLDLMELHFVRMFRQYGVSMPVIRAAAAEGARLFGTDHPFAVRRFSTDGTRIFAVLEQHPPAGVSASKLMEELHACQLVFMDMVEPFLKDADIAHEEIARYWPLGKGKCVVIDPRRGLGKPIDCASGVRTFALYEAFLGTADERAVAAWYGVSLKAVRSAIEFEKRLAAA
ncbi:MAG: hypothetical protein FJX74_15450 [Armatimonadetes bacterium]|nr:hypothetical protein [Armatimonadota bacterium]